MRLRFPRGITVAVLGIVAAAAFLVPTRREASIAENPEAAVAVVASAPSDIVEPLDSVSTVAPTPLDVVRGERSEAVTEKPTVLQHVVVRPVEPPEQVRLTVPFVSQAPFRIWDLPYKEFCEEASVLTLHLWKQGKRTPPADQLDRELKAIQEWEIANLGEWEDTPADLVVRILREKYGHTKARVVRDVTVEAMKAELRKGRPFIVPAAGRELPNPYFRQPGPLYHMLVVIGYDDARGEFITNDVGTNTKGAGLRYRYQDLYDAMHDWVSEASAPTGGKVMIVLE